MGIWHKTACVLCAQNCGLEVLVEDNRMIKVRPDKDNPRSQGYACRKGLNVLYHQYPEDRLNKPLKRTEKGFVSVSWEEAIQEIADKLRALIGRHGPRSLAYMGGSSQGGHFEASFGLGLLRALGSQYYYSSAGQEFSGIWWLFGRMLGRQYHVAIPDEHASKMLVGWGWNGMESHQMPRARKTLTDFSKDPDRTLVIIDPRKSETAEIADIHLPVRPGTDALLAKAMIATIVQEGWENREYIEQHVAGWDKLASWFNGFDVEEALAVCELDPDQVKEVCRLMTTRTWCMHPDLGVYMGRNSTLNTYFINLLGVVCGIFCVSGGNVIPGMVMPMGFHADERSPKTWRTVTTQMPPAAAGSFPPNVLPEEILSDHPERIRAVLVSACNPLRSYADTKAYAKAFSNLDLLVVNELVMSETARFAHYVLPCRSYYESWDGTFFPWTFPEVYFQMRRPIVSPPGDCLEASQIFTRLADRLGLIPEIPENLCQAATGNRLAFGMALMQWASTAPEALKRMPFVLAQTLGRQWDSAALAALWGLLMTAPQGFRKNAERAGFAAGPDLGDRMFQAILDHPEGLWVGKASIEDNWAAIRTPSGKIEVAIPELDAAGSALSGKAEAEALKMPAEFPFILNAGRHMDRNMNTLMRNPDWNKGKRDCTIAISPGDAARLGFSDGDPARVETEAGSATGEIEVSQRVREGMVLIPHGFGLLYGETVHGLNVNELTKNTHRDFLGTPIHRFVPCRIEKMQRQG
jgi:anaerobic selenocysteine-containing dehydrogenase